MGNDLTRKRFARWNRVQADSRAIARQGAAMHESYLGDYYDLVKYFWRSTLDPIAKLYAHPRFVPADLAKRYTALTSLKIHDHAVEKPFGILLDPDTGIRLPSYTADSASA